MDSTTRSSSLADAASGDRLERLHALLAHVARGNAFQRERFGVSRLAHLDELARLPLTHKDDLLADQAAHPRSAPT